MKKFLLVLVVTASVACGIPKAVNGRSTANLTQPGITALHTTEVIKVLDVIRDTAVDGLAAKVIPEATSTRVVDWHRAAVLTIQQAPNGWSATTISGLNNLKATLTSSEVSVIGPYIDSAIALIKALGV